MDMYKRALFLISLACAVQSVPVPRIEIPAQSLAMLLLQGNVGQQYFRVKQPLQIRTKRASRKELDIGGLHLAQRIPAHLDRASALVSRSSEVRMDDVPFWENVVRYMRFGVSAFSGLLLALLSPFSYFLRTPQLRVIGGTLISGILVFVLISLQSMTSDTPLINPTPPSAQVEQQQPQRQRTRLQNVEMDQASQEEMLREIYGNYK